MSNPSHPPKPAKPSRPNLKIADWPTWLTPSILAFVLPGLYCALVILGELTRGHLFDAFLIFFCAVSFGLALLWLDRLHNPSVYVSFPQTRPLDPPATCAHCGYDLRATPLLCPECGQKTPLQLWLDRHPLDRYVYNRLSQSAPNLPPKRPSPRSNP